MEWQPIETAPKDGTRIILYRPGTHFEWVRVVIGRYYTDSYASKPKPFWGHDRTNLTGVREARANQPTHWMPLPEPPR